MALLSALLDASFSYSCFFFLGTISNPYDDEEDDWEEGREIIEDDEDDEGDEDIDIESVWDEMNKEAGGKVGGDGDDMIDVK